MTNCTVFLLSFHLNGPSTQCMSLFGLHQALLRLSCYPYYPFCYQVCTSWFRHLLYQNKKNNKKKLSTGIMDSRNLALHQNQKQIRITPSTFRDQVHPLFRTGIISSPKSIYNVRLVILCLHNT